MAEFRLGRVKFNWTGNWQPSKSYLIDDIIKFGGNTYVAVQNHTSVASTSDFYATDLAKWNVHLEGITNTGDWIAGVYYRVNEVFKFGNVQYRVTTAHLSAGTFPDLSKVTEYLAGFKAEGEWSNDVQYQSGDVVNYQGSSYVALTTSLAGFLPPTNVAIGTDIAGKTWQVLADGLAGAAITFTAGTYYRGQLVQYGGNIYRHKVGVTTNVYPLGAGDTMTGVGIGNSVWDLLVQGFKFVGNFSTTFNYSPGHVARFGSNSYVAVGNSFSNITPTAGLGTYWETLAAGDSAAALTTKGDILTYNGGPFRIGIGSTGYALAVNADGLPGYQIVGAQTRVYYVDSEAGSNNNNGLAPNLAFATIKKACEAARPDRNITNFEYTASTGLSTVTAPGHGLKNVGTFIQLQNIQFECTSGGNSYGVLGFNYTPTTGIATVTAINIGLAPETGIGNILRLRDVQVSYNPGTGTTTGLFANAFGESNFPITAIPSNNSVALNVGIRTYGFSYIGGGSIFAGITTTIFPDVASKSYFEVLQVLDPNRIIVNVGPSTIGHTYVTGGHLTDLTPAVLRLSASQFYEQLPIIVPPFTSIVGHSLRGTTVLPKDGFSDDNVTPNNRSAMFKLSDATTIQALAFKGLEGFHYDAAAPFEINNTNIRTGVGTTACGKYFVLNENSPINNKSPYVKDCTCFSDPASEDGRFGGGGVGVFIDGGIHQEGAKSMVFDAFTMVNSDGAGYVLDKNAIAEIVSCFTYYCKWGYYSGGGSRIRAVGGNNSYGDYGVISSGFSTAEAPRAARIFGDQMKIQAATIAGTVAVGQTMVGQTSGSRGWILNDQRSADKLHFKYYPGYGATATAANGNIAIGTSPFIDGEVVYTYDDTSGAGYAGSFYVGAAASSLSGQKGTILEVDAVSSTLLVGDSVGFNTTFGQESLFYIINTVSNVAAAVTYRNALTGIAYTYYNRATLTISPDKGRATPDTRNRFTDQGGDFSTLVSAGSSISVRTRFSQVRLTGHDFLYVGTGNKTETNYPNVDESALQQGNETRTYGPGKVFFVSTDQGGNFRVGQFFSVNQLTGRATLDASAFNLSGLTELRLGAIGGQVGESINEFSSDETMSGNSNSACPTEFAVRGFLTRNKMGVGAMVPPVGTTAQRPGGIDASFVAGALRFNTTIGALEYYNGTAWVAPGKLTYNTITASGTTMANNNVYFVNTTGGAVTITLPASPSLGDTVRILDIAKTFDNNNLTVARNGQLIQGDAQDLTVNIEGAAFELMYSGATFGWRIFSI